MYSAFASPAVQNGPTFVFDATPSNPNIWKHKRYTEFVVYKLPLMLESHSSSPASHLASATSASPHNNKKHKRQCSLLTDAAGIIACSNVKTVSFGVPCTLVYKNDTA